jgi:tetratricopeptide (TPR) repeat protein
LLKDPSTIKSKLAFYGKLLELELQDHPNNYKACFELALHYRNYGKIEDAKALLRKCAEGKPDFLRAKLELALIELNEGLVYLDACKGYKADTELLGLLQKLHQTLASWRFTPLQLEEETVSNG